MVTYTEVVRQRKFLAQLLTAYVKKQLHLREDAETPAVIRYLISNSFKIGYNRIRKHPELSVSLLELPLSYAINFGELAPIGSAASYFLIKFGKKILKDFETESKS